MHFFDVLGGSYLRRRIASHSVQERLLLLRFLVCCLLFIVLCFCLLLFIVVCCCLQNLKHLHNDIPRPCFRDMPTRAISASRQDGPAGLIAATGPGRPGRFNGDLRSGHGLFQGPSNTSVLATHKSRTGLSLKDGSVGARKYVDGKCVPEKFDIGGRLAV